MQCCAAAASTPTPPARAEAPLTDSLRIQALRSEARALESGGAGDMALAMARYCEAARLGDAVSQYDLGWMLANGRGGIARDDAQAAFFLKLAADQGLAQAANVLRLIGEPVTPIALPECLREPVAPNAANAANASAAAPVPVLAPKALAALVDRIAPKFRVAQPLVLAIMKAESNFDRDALSPKKAQGLMQLIPDTASRFRVGDAFDPAQNIRGGVAYLRWLLAYFEGDVALVAAAYNAGEGTVDRYRGVPPYQETRAYVKRILAAVGPTAQPFDSGIVAPSPYLAEIRERQRVR